MYRLEVFHPEHPSATEVISLRSAGEVLRAIPDLLSKHRDCMRLEVHLGVMRLFSVGPGEFASPTEP